MNYLLHLSIYFSMYCILAISLNLVVGLMGRLNMAHAGFMAVGAYSYALATIVFGWGLMGALCLAVIVAALLSLLLSLPSWRFKGDFFVMITLAVQALLFGVIHNWSSPGAPLGTWANMTNGTFGINGIPRPGMFGIKLETMGAMSAVSISLALVCGGILFRLTNSPWGRLLKCCRDDELALRGLGKNIRLLKVQAFVLSCSFAAIGGVVYASYLSYVDSSAAALDQSILLLCMICVGGLGNFRGPIVGAFVLLLFPEILRFMPFPQAIAANIRLLAYGLLLLLTVHFRPQGISGEYRME